MVREPCGCIIRVSGGLRTLLKSCPAHQRRFADLRGRMVAVPVRRRIVIGPDNLDKSGGVRRESLLAAARVETASEDWARFREATVAILTRIVFRLKVIERRLDSLESAYTVVPGEPLTLDPLLSKVSR